MSAPKIDLGRAVVVITGAARGIGRATAEEFIRGGATVCLGDLDGEAASVAASALGRTAHPFRVDVRSPASFAEFIEAVHTAAGPVDVLVNNAGVMPTGRFLEESEATTETVLAVNLAGPVHGMRAVLPEMVERGRGHIVNVASLLGKIEAPGLATYVASKHGLVGLTAAVRAELEDTGVTLTCVLPSVVSTELGCGIRIAAPLRWLARVEPRDVARAIVASCDGRPREVAVPRWLAVYPVLRPFIPDRIEDLGRRLIGYDAALGGVDGDARAAYRRRVSDQVSDPG